MALNASNVPAAGGTGNKVEQPPLEPGVYKGRLVQLIDFGLQPRDSYKGEDKAPAYLLGLTYELSDEFMIDEDGKEIEDKPRWISEQIPLFHISSDLAKSTKRYKALDENMEFGGDWTKLIGSPCMITITNSISKKNGKVYENVAAIGKMREKDVKNLPELVNPPKMFDLDDPDMAIFGSFPQWIQDKIKSNLNFKGSKLAELLGDTGDAPAEKEAEPENDDLDDEVPF